MEGSAAFAGVALRGIPGIVYDVDFTGSTAYRDLVSVSTVRRKRFVYIIILTLLKHSRDIMLQHAEVHGWLSWKLFALFNCFHRLAIGVAAPSTS